MSDVELRSLGPDDGSTMIALDRLAFPVDDENLDPAVELSLFEWDRTRGAFIAGQPAGQYTVYSLTLPVPGGAIPVGGLSWVGVHPQHRRQGVLRAMISDHLQGVKERGEAISALNASEAVIYGRFGYGVNNVQLRSTIGRGSELRDVAGSEALKIRFEVADADRHADLVGDVYERAARTRPGMTARPTPAQRRARLYDPPSWRDGAERLHILVAEDETGPRGFALFRRKLGFSRGSVPEGEVTIREIVAEDPATARALWGRVLDLDLMSVVHTDDRPVDDPIHHLLVDRRAASSVAVDGLWLRLVDVAGALGGRRYSAPVDVVFAVHDQLLPENDGTYRLTAGPDHARCERSDEAPAFELDTRELASTYLGSITLDSLASAGLVRVNDVEAFGSASRAFAWPVAAYCGWRF